MADMKCRITSRLIAAILCGVSQSRSSRNVQRKTIPGRVEVHLFVNRHPFTVSILRLYPEYERKTGELRSVRCSCRKKSISKSSITQFSSRSSFYDLFMLGFPPMLQYAKAGVARTSGSIH